MKGFFGTIALFFLVIFLLPEQPPVLPPSPALVPVLPVATSAPAVSQVVEKPVEEDPASVPVLRVVDGDTFSVLIDGKKETVRVIGLDTPETVDPRKPVQCFGNEASLRAKELLEGKRVRLEADATQGERDKYQRLLVYAYLLDGTLFNKRMIEEGFGHEYTYKTPYRFQAEFKDAERRAREEKRGLWADGVCG